MTRFSIRRLLVSVSMVAVGLAIIAKLLYETSFPGSFVAPLFHWPVWCGAGALVGAGLLNPIRLAWLGALIGAVLQLAIVPWVF